MLNFRQSPLLRIVFPFITGIIAYRQNAGDATVFCIIVIAVLLFIYIMLHAVKLPYRYRHCYSIFIFSISALCGYHTACWHTDINRDNHFSRFNYDGLVIRLLEPTEQTVKTYKASAEVEFAYDSILMHETAGKIMVYFKGGAEFKYGDRLIVDTKAFMVKPPVNPDEFDYSRHLSYKGIYHQAVVDSGKWRIASNEGNAVVSFSYKLRDRLISVLKSTMPDKDIYSVASALLVGYENDLGDELMDAYAGTGTLHVLSVSGMHVALIYKVLELIFSFLLNLKRGRHLFFLILLSALWFYAMLSGLSPSVLRATMMLTFILMGKWMSRMSSPANSIAASCLFLFVINPFLVMETGFRLSLLAVIGIIYIHPLLFRLITPSGKVWYAFWSITSVSISAQLATFPLCIYYFHQFPLLFVVSNLLIIPATTVAIYAALVLVVVSEIPIAGFIASKATYYAIWFANKAAELINSVPASTYNGISINEYEVLILYVLIIVGIIFLIYKRLIHLVSSLLLLILFSSLQLAENIKLSNVKRLVVFCIKGQTSIALSSGKNCYLISDSISEKQARFHMQAHMFKCGWERIIMAGNNFSDSRLLRRDHFIQFENKVIVIADSLFCRSAPAGLNADYLILKRGCFLSPLELSKKISAKKIIIDSSVPAFLIKRWNTTVPSGTLIYDVNAEGAFAENINQY